MNTRVRVVGGALSLVVVGMLAAAGRAEPLDRGRAAPAEGMPARLFEALQRGMEAPVVTGTIDAVTVFRGQAQVTRVVEVAGGTGLRELVVTGLPEALIPASLYGESAEGIEVRSVSYRVRPVGEDVRETVREAEKALREAKDALSAAEARRGFLEWHRQYLDKLEAFIAPSAQAELKSGVLNAETLTKLTDLVTTLRERQRDEGQKLAIEARTLQEAVDLRQRELSVLSASRSRTAREAVVFVNVTKPGARLRLTYLVNGANWAPSYNLRAPRVADGGAGEGARTVTLEYQASVQQMTGEDWGNVQLTLSTATPALVAMGPSLEPLSVALAPAQQAAQGLLAQLKDRSYDDAKRELAMRQREAEQSRARNFGNYAFNAAPTTGASQTMLGSEPSSTGLVVGEPSIRLLERDGGGAVFSLDKGLNDLADQSQLLDLISSARVERKGRGDAPVVRQGDEGVSVSYKVGGRTTMPSRADQQLIQIAQLELPASVRRVATPSLTQYVYNEARVTNAADRVLLAGPAASYVDGEFVGSAGVPTIAAGEGFRAGFGIDTSLRTSKELVERAESHQGGNRIIEFTYRVAIENFGKAAALVTVLDRLPTPKGSEIKLTLLSQSPSLSEDREYQETDRKRNLMRWDISVPAGATGTNATIIEYRFRLEFDRQMMLTEGT
ncbi:MAG: mucoidy inhibitor MuiA family protein [Phycisphaerales bacterium]